MEDADVLIVFSEILLVDDVATFDIAPQARTDVVMDMIATERNAGTFRDLDAAGLPFRIEAIDIVRPDALELDADLFAVAFDAVCRGYPRECRSRR